ncbi:hypothetical protein CRUP_004693, partial [Coryphaenoides rupestris]
HRHGRGASGRPVSARPLRHGPGHAHAPLGRGVGPHAPAGGRDASFPVQPEPGPGPPAPPDRRGKRRQRRCQRRFLALPPGRGGQQPDPGGALPGGPAPRGRRGRGHAGRGAGDRGSGPSVLRHSDHLFPAHLHGSRHNRQTMLRPQLLPESAPALPPRGPSPLPGAASLPGSRGQPADPPQPPPLHRPGEDPRRKPLR